MQQFSLRLFLAMAAVVGVSAADPATDNRNFLNHPAPEGTPLQATQSDTTPPLVIKGASQIVAGVVSDYFAPIDPANMTTLRSDARFPNHPNRRSLLTAGLESPAHQGQFYGEWIHGYLVPPETGDYVFYVAAGETAELYLSSNDLPEDLGTLPICAVPAATDPRQYDKYTNQMSALINLEAGRLYYFEAYRFQNTGQDHFTVTWRKPSDVTAPASGADPIPGENLVELLDPSQTTIDIVQQPVDVTVPAFQPAAFQIVAEGDSSLGALLSYQWYRDGFPIDSATNSSYTLAQAMPSDSASVFHVTVFNWDKMVDSPQVTLTVLNDDQPPTLAQVRVKHLPSTDGDAVVLSFSEAIDPDSALNGENYQFSPSWEISHIVVNNGTNVILNGAELPLDIAYHLNLTNSAVKDLSTNALAPTNVTFASLTILPRKVMLELYADLPGEEIDDLTQSAKYQSGLADQMWLLEETAAPANQAVNFGQRLSGYFIPAESGDYTFTLDSSGNSQLCLSADGNPAHLNSTPILTTTPDTAQTSPPQTLAGGQLYWFEVIMKRGIAGSGGNHLSLAWSVNGDTNTYLLNSTNLAARLDLNSVGIVLLQSPTNIQVFENQTAVFAVDARGVSDYRLPLFYQWFRNGTSIDGATNAVYTTPVLSLTNQNDQYHCQLALSDVLTNTTAPAILTVLPDTQPPTALFAGSLGRTIGIRFSELMATNQGAFTINGGTPAAVVKWLDGQTVVLSLGQPITSPVILTYSVHDRSGNPTNGTISVGFNGLTALDIGTTNHGDSLMDPAVAGETIPLASGQLRIQAGGSGIGGTNDHFHFAHKSYQGDFDVKVRVSSLLAADGFAQAGLMARESLAAGSRQLNVVATPAGPVTQLGNQGANEYENSVRTQSNALTTSWSGGIAYNQDIPYPEAWVRLQRQGNWFSAYRSWDGLSWLPMAKASNAFSATLWVGLCVSANNNYTNGFAQAEFADFGDTLNASAWINCASAVSNRFAALGDNPGQSQGKEKAFDTSTTTSWLDFRAASWLQVKFASNASYVVSRYGIASGSDSSDRDPASWALSGSTNGTQWVVLDARGNQPAWENRRAWKFFAIAHPSNFAYYRLDLTNHAGDICQISEWGLLAVEITHVPNLQIQKSASSVVLRWPDTSGISLAQSPILATTANWDVIGTGELTNGERRFPIKPTDSKMYYRLKK